MILLDKLLALLKPTLIHKTGFFQVYRMYILWHWKNVHGWDGKIFPIKVGNSKTLLYSLHTSLLFLKSFLLRILRYTKVACIYYFILRVYSWNCLASVIELYLQHIYSLSHSNLALKIDWKTANTYNMSVSSVRAKIKKVWTGPVVRKAKCLFYCCNILNLLHYIQMVKW